MKKDILQIIPIHYDVQEHSLDINVFIAAAQGVEIITGDIGEIITGNKIKYKIVILPPEEGTFRQFIGIALLSLLAPIAPEIGSGVVKGLTGKGIGEWSEKGAECLKECVISWLEKEDSELQQILNGLPKDIDLSKSIKAKNDFYITCQNNPEITAIGFTEEDNFPVKRENFMNHVSESLFNKNLPPPLTIYKLHKLTIVSPVIMNSNAKWRVIIDTEGDRIRNMAMEDNDFFEDVLAGKYKIKESELNATMDALVRYEAINGSDKYNSFSIVTVYRINEIVIAKIPENIHFDESSLNKDPQQLSFF